MESSTKRRAIRLAAGLLAAVAAAILIAACGGSGDSSTGGGSGGGGETIKVGFVGPLSGPLSAAGKGGLNGAEAAIEYLNEGGAKSGDTFELLTQDDKGDPTQTAAAARKLVGEGAKMIMVGPTPGGGGAIQPIVNQSKILNIGPDTDTISEGMKPGGEFPYAFGTGPGLEQYAGPMVEYAANSLGVKKLGSIYGAGPLGEVYVSSMEVAAKKLGVEIVKQSFPESQADVTAQLRQLRGEGVEVLTVWTFGTPLVNVAQSLAKIDWEPTILTVQGSAEPGLIETLEREAPGTLKKMYGGAISTNLLVEKAGEAPKGKLATAFVEHLKKVTGDETLDGNAPTSVYLFDSMIAYDQGIAATGGTDSDEIAKYFDTTPVEIAQGETDWPTDRATGVPSSDLGLFLSASDWSNGTGVAAPGQ
jgi:ABC-type branched-subunit amino acid transport system substrate-binding protein